MTASGTVSLITRYVLVATGPTGSAGWLGFGRLGLGLGWLGLGWPGLGRLVAPERTPDAPGHGTAHETDTSALRSRK